MGQSVTRALQAVDQHKARPEQIDSVIIAAINVTLCLASGGDDRVAEGFNNDIAVNGQHFGCHPPDRVRARLHRATYERALDTLRLPPAPSLGGDQRHLR